MDIRTRELLSAVTFLLLSIIMYVASLNIKSMTNMGVGPAFAPKLVAIGMFAFSLFLLIKELRIRYILRKSKNDSNNKVFVKENWSRYRSASLTILLIVSYIFVIPIVGFLISTIFYLYIQFCLLGDKKYWNRPLFVGLSLIVAVTVYFIFRLGFEVRLPTGVFL
ncbi:MULTISPECIES: tripartite tricarboxylate transporter TctB family protein [unclassified Sporosarcina]|uniref:tripartite tricarboxylate transporter TctB family protein n=1 Tax=unclassified Sporosarcina TaxID=2647733 RepID=UPI00203AEA45|nr:MULTISPECIES: tripartite tricarboxylate transporter TctB family protein [unclassified Sporosarcina]GKV65916.1 hypothetical protein NCCP2331_20690 [Sporosarcina sp. NCCP-2331]GLB56084.1 hypothetical protein NCCP2378_18710 [Sporosarcina sp. NCCP-2378]